MNNDMREEHYGTERRRKGVGLSFLSVAGLVVWGVLGFSVFADAAPLAYRAASSELPHVSREMKTPGFWIARHPDPDGVVMGPIGIEGLNAGLCAQGIIADLKEFPVRVEGARLKDELATILRGVKKRVLFDAGGQEAGAAFYQRIDAEAGLEDIPAIVEPRPGFAVVSAAQRLLPTREPLYAKAGDMDFDEVQNSSLAVGEPVLVLYQSRSGGWLFVKDAIASGWVEASQIAFASREEFLSYFQTKKMILVTEPKADLYLDREMRRYDGSVRMGSRFMLKGVFGRSVEVFLPKRQPDGSVVFVSGFLDRQDVSFGFLPFTARVIYRQAFKMLNAPYGWGDMYGEQDCSRFLQMIFASVGIFLPRNSGEQGRVGTMVEGFLGDLPLAEKRVIVSDRAVGGTTILRFQGHVALYLGSVDGTPYAIHATWAYREPSPEGDQVRLINRVVVTDLDLGQGSQKGSLLGRLLSARMIGKN